MPVTDEWLLLPAALERYGRADAHAYLRREIQRRLQHWLRFGKLEGLRLLELPATEAWARLFVGQGTIVDELTGQVIPRQQQDWIADPEINWDDSTMTGPEGWPAVLVEISAQLVAPPKAEAEAPTMQPAPAPASQPPPEPQPVTGPIAEAILELWPPAGEPPPNMRASERNKLIGQKLRTVSHSPDSFDRAVRRALADLRARRT
jgi:hypothetical protein